MESTIQNFGSIVQGKKYVETTIRNFGSIVQGKRSVWKQLYKKTKICGINCQEAETRWIITRWCDQAAATKRLRPIILVCMVSLYYNYLCNAFKSKNKHWSIWWQWWVFLLSLWDSVRLKVIVCMSYPWVATLMGLVETDIRNYRCLNKLKYHWSSAESLF